VRARRLVAHGRVQGVFFRDETRRQAHRHGLVGWVRNRADGAVEAHLEGPPDAVEAVEAWIRAGGPPRAQVTEVTADDVDVEGHEGFEVTG
jgi:acylphosphatase